MMRYPIALFSALTLGGCAASTTERLHLPPLYRSLLGGRAFFVNIPGEFDDKNRIFARQGDHEDQTYLRIKIALETSDY